MAVPSGKISKFLGIKGFWGGNETGHTLGYKFSKSVAANLVWYIG